MADFKLREEEPIGGRTIDDLVDGVAEDLGLTREAHLEALEDGLKDKKLCGIVHPYVADALLNRLYKIPNETFEVDVYPSSRLVTRNPTHFKNVAIFVHRVAPIPGSSKGKLACTWAFDLDPEECSVAELKRRLELLASTSSERMRLVFNGFTLTATNALAEYDIQGGDSLYLYTVKDPNETTVICCSGEETPHTSAPAAQCCCCTSPPHGATCSAEPCVAFARKSRKYVARLLQNA
ncbi:uncharacterized protein LOC34621058 [Cyclospora cayetanensis]|uniref:Uncharacterized protein LOC34621058 n=1 Tax=Cyclospora cayetanensis TaxID=88456 RepID=A0A6P6RWC8_9EIME|nr:uncharacterized protein LOC34621058 [Cyclospora cayetanensis]